MLLVWAGGLWTLWKICSLLWWLSSQGLKVFHKYQLIKPCNVPVRWSLCNWREWVLWPQVWCLLWNPICDSHNLPQVEQMYCCCVWKWELFEMQLCLCYWCMGSSSLLICSTIPCSPVLVSWCLLPSAHTSCAFFWMFYLVPHFPMRAWHRCMLCRSSICSS